MTRFWAIIENTWKEGIAKKTILVIFILTTIIIGFFLLALSEAQNVLYLFGQEINADVMDDSTEEIIRTIEAGIIGFFYQVAIFIGIFAIASFYPSMQEKGTVDLLLSRPMSRFNIFLAKFIGCMLVVFSLIFYLIMGTWLVIYMKTGIAFTEYLLTIPIFMLIFFSFMSFVAMIGIISRSTATSAVMALFFPFIFSSILFGFHESGIMDGHGFWGDFFNVLYVIFPKTIELMDWNITLVAAQDIARIDLPFAIGSTLAFSIVCYAVGSFVFQRRSY